MSTPNTQQQMIQDAMKAIAERKPGRTKLVYDKTKRTIVAVAEGSQVPRALNITADDADMFGILTLSSGWLRDHWADLSKSGHISASFNVWDAGDCFTQSDFGVQRGETLTQGEIIAPDGGNADVKAQLKIHFDHEKNDIDVAEVFLAPDGRRFRASAKFNGTDGVKDLQVEFADIQPSLATRRAGILETSVLNDKTALCIGVGTGGAHAALELAKCGVGHFILVDRDRLSVGNVVRHPGGISQVGRYKVNVVRDLIHEKNPDANVEIHSINLGYDNADEIRKLIAKADVVICGTDNRQSKLLINQLCIDEDVVAIYGGAFRRAYGGQVLRVRPKKSPCHQCFISAMPEESSDVEISTGSDATEIAYSDRPVAVEPGLSLDVLPIANMLTKLALMELLTDKQTSLSILNRDYDAPWFLWLNRPEPGTSYATMPPLSESSDEMTINRWYGIYFDRDTACPACGNFMESVAQAYGLNPSSIGTLPAAAAKE